jgi:hypothetical protein
VLTVKDYKTFRIREEVKLLHHYIEWKMMKEGIHKDLAFDTVINDSMTRLENKEFIHIEVTSKKQTEISGFKISPINYKRFQNFRKHYEILVSDLISICYYIYALKHLNQEELDDNYIKDWDVSVITNNLI